MTEETNLAVTPPAEYPGWREPELHRLPSGAVFKLRKPQLRKMIQRGQIPNPLMEVIGGVFRTRDETELAAEAEAKGMSEEELVEQRRLEAEADQDDPSKPPPIPRTREQIEEEMTPTAALKFADVIVWASIVEPTVEFEPPANGPLTASGALSYEVIDEDDRLYILQYANGDFDTVAPFPADGERQDAGSDGREVRDEAELAVGHPA